MSTAVEQEIRAFVAARASRLFEIARDLVRIPSENRAPEGAEWECQNYVAETLRRHGWDPQLYTPDEAPGIASHPLFWPGRNYTRRPNVGARRVGRGGGRSLVLSGHIDTVPAGTQPWTRDPFGGEIEGNRLYGRGSSDMKGGVASNLFVVEALSELGIDLAGDLVFETVVDEEFGGVNGTLAGRLKKFNADAAVISEPTNLRICPAQRGGRTVQITFSAPNGGVLDQHASEASVTGQLRCFLNELEEFTRARRECAPAHPMYAHLADAVPVTVTRIVTAPWGTSEPTNTPSSCRAELFWQAMPGESVLDIDRAFFNWFDKMCNDNQETFRHRPTVEFPIRWLPGSSLESGSPLIEEFRSAAATVLDDAPLVQGIEGPCDMYVFHQFGMPAILWGARGGNAHNADEYVELDSLVESTAVLLTFVCRWCQGLR